MCASVQGWETAVLGPRAQGDKANGTAPLTRPEAPQARVPASCCTHVRESLLEFQDSRMPVVDIRGGNQQGKVFLRKIHLFKEGGQGSGTQRVRGGQAGLGLGSVSRCGQFPPPLHGNNAPSSSEAAWRSEWTATSTGLGTAGLEADAGWLQRAVPRLCSPQLPLRGTAHSAVLGGRGRHVLGTGCTSGCSHRPAGPRPQGQGIPSLYRWSSPKQFRESQDPMGVHPVRNGVLQVAVPLGR